MNNEQLAYERVNIYNTEKIDANLLCELIQEEARECDCQVMISDVVYKIVKIIRSKGDNHAK